MKLGKWACVGVVSVLGVLSLGQVANAQCSNAVELDPGAEFRLFSSNSNDGYSAFRGMVITANEDFRLAGLGLWTKKSAGVLNATFEVYKIVVTSGNVLAGATKIGQGSAELSGDLGYKNGDLDAQVEIVAGSSYLVRVGYAEAAEENWFYRWNRGDVNVGPVNVIDGTLGGNTSNTVAPGMQLLICSGCGDKAKLKAKCKAEGKKVNAKMKKANANTPVTFKVDGGQDRSTTTNNKGKAKAKWKGLQQGKHEVTVCDLKKSCG